LETEKKEMGERTNLTSFPKRRDGKSPFTENE